MDNSIGKATTSTVDIKPIPPPKSKSPVLTGTQLETIFPASCATGNIQVTIGPKVAAGRNPVPIKPLLKPPTITTSKGNNIVSSIGLVPSGTGSSTGTFLNFTISNGELKPCSSTIVRDRLKEPNTTISGSAQNLQKPIIVTVSGLQSGPPTLTPGNAQLDGSHANPEKTKTVPSKISATSIFTALSNSAGNIPIIVSPAPPTLCKGAKQTGILSVTPIANSQMTATSNTNLSAKPVKNSNLTTTTASTTSNKNVTPKPPFLINVSQIPNSKTVVTPGTSSSSSASSSSALTKNPIVCATSSPSVSMSIVNSNTSSEDAVSKVPELNDTDPTSPDYDPIQAMDWKDGIASLPGSNLKFKLNEFGTLEIIMEESGIDNKDMPNLGKPETSNSANEQSNVPKDTASRKRKVGRPPTLQKAETSKIENDVKVKPENASEQIQRCENCGTYGLNEEFYGDTNFCCKECLIISTKKKEFKRKRMELVERKKMKILAAAEPQPPSPGSSDDSSNAMEEEAVNVKPAQPINTKKFFWTTYLEQEKAIAAPVKLFSEQSQGFPTGKNMFRVGMKLEGIDPRHPSLFCVLTVVELVGFRMRLHFDGYSDCYDFWLNADSADIFPVGWCEKTGHKLQPPKGYTTKTFNWPSYLKVSKSVAAPKNIFLSRIPASQTPHSFRVGMKLEAVDKKNSSLVCVATVMDVMKTRFLVHFDGWDDMYDYWTPPTSPYIHPINWCREMGHVLTPPNSTGNYHYKDANNFDWDEYLTKTKSIAVTPKCFKQKHMHGFKIGMKLEAVDKRNPMLIRVATVADIQPHSILLHFDGWSDAYDYWVDDDVPDIHPVCWCFNAGFPLQPPITHADSIAEQSGCPTPGCTGIGHIKGPKFISHHSAFGCPYSLLNMNKDSTLGDRLGTARAGEAVFIEPLVKKSEAAAASNTLTPPDAARTNDAQIRFRRCPTPGCNGMGHITGKYTVHHRVSGCPLAEKNSQKERAAAAIASIANHQEKENGFSDSQESLTATSPSPSEPLPALFKFEVTKTAAVSKTENVKPSTASVSRPPSVVGKPLNTLAKPANVGKQPVGRPPGSVCKAPGSVGKTPGSNGKINNSGEGPKKRGRKKKVDIIKDQDYEEEDDETAPAEESCGLPVSEDSKSSSTNSLQDNVHKSVFTSTAIFHPSSREETSLCWNQHSLLLPGITEIKGFHVKKWMPNDVSSFVVGLTGIIEMGKRFRDEQVDGEAFLLLNQMDIVKLLSIKLGPALKIYNCILMFKKTLED